MSEKITDALLLLLERPLCAGCIASEVAVAELDVDPLLARIHDTIYVGRSTERCGACTKTALVYSLARTG
jgi:hypothetical protein